MSVLTQGTQLFVLAKGAVSEIECITAFSPGSNPADQIEDTCLSERLDRTYKRGLRTPGAASLTLNADPKNTSHIMLYNLSISDAEDDQDLTFAIGWSDGTASPSAAAEGAAGAVDGLTLPDSRTWFVFKGYVSDFPFDFAANTVVSSSASIQRSGSAVWVPKAAASA